VKELLRVKLKKIHPIVENLGVERKAILKGEKWEGGGEKFSG